MATASLENPRLRLKRADEHLDAFYPAIRTYISRSPYLISDKLQREGDWHVQRMHIRERPDPAWALLVSEVIHHLRAALDNLVWQLVLLNGAEPTCRNQFPIYTKRAPSVDRLDAMLGGVRKDHRTRIEDMQPHLGLDTPIRRALAELVQASNVDKHRSLHGAFGVVRNAPKPNVRYTYESVRGRLEVVYQYGPLEDGAVVVWYRFQAQGEVHVNVDGAIPIEIVFGDRELGGDTIEELRLRVLEVVEGFAPDFPRASGRAQTIPQATWGGIRVFIPRSQRVKLKENRAFERTKAVRAHRLFPEQLAEQASQLVLVFRGSMLRELEEARCLDGATAIWSLWSGYLDGPAGQRLKNDLDRLGIPLRLLHASGHATVQDLQRLATTLGPEQIVPIHTAAPERYDELFEGVMRHHDGEWWSV
jgi:hypothetical protein